MRDKTEQIYKELTIYVEYYILKGYLRRIVKDGKQHLARGPHFSRMKSDKPDINDVKKFIEKNKGLKARIY